MWLANQIVWIGTHLVFCKYVANIFSSSHALYEPKMASGTVTKADKKDVQTRTKATTAKVMTEKTQERSSDHSSLASPTNSSQQDCFHAFNFWKPNIYCCRKQCLIVIIYTENDPVIITTYLVRPQYDIVSASRFLLDSELRWLS